MLQPITEYLIKDDTLVRAHTHAFRYPNYEVRNLSQKYALKRVNHTIFVIWAFKPTREL